MAEEMVFVFSDGELRVLQTWNLSVGVGEWAAGWPESIFFYGEIATETPLTPGEELLWDIFGKPEKMYLVCNSCGEAFDEIETAYSHDYPESDCGDSFRIAPESEAM
jgi:hypothetical protein